MGVRFTTTRFGELDLPEEKVFTFPQGLIGFADVRRFALVDHPRGGPFQWLQSLDLPGLAFVITDPRIFFPGYSVPVRPEDLAPIGLETLDDAAVVVILVVPHDARRITANLQGPIVINVKERLARQIVLEVPGYTTQHPIFPKAKVNAAAQAEEAPC